ncbi:ABC transporter substrate-binding protein [Acetanaerobacterium elongatum]|uniref:Carbohydrate ABC transporter substrate-binding protein, CUT1 family n=1 Tax=Acetanaerobacterium elongatum TaxID=258515 RepID=A0A1G9ZK04_9FIRM|nr:extracellular solute-binding protein [Acetanaerobacterium elongatum]SDN21669.1 carbohydrate ABC transporter substrate-binding protein, CUT1 family [Acetanaerobacterium elongatum]
MKKAAAYLIAAILCSTMITACAQGIDIHNTTMGDESSASTCAAQLTTFTLFADDSSDGAVYKSLLEEFKAKNQAVQISDTSEAFSEDIVTELAAAFESGSQPDVFFFHTGVNAAAFTKENLIVPVDEIKVKYPDYAQDIAPYALESIADGGKAMAVPVRGFYEGLFVNTDLFEQYELELPTNWPLFVKAINAFSKAGIIPVSASLNDTPHYLLDQLILAAGGAQNYKTLPKAVGEVPQSWLSAMQTLSSLNKQGAFGQPEACSSEGEATDLFMQKKAAMKADGSWLVARLEASGLGDSTIVLPFPMPEGGKRTDGEITGGFSSGFYISRKAWDDVQKQAAAVKLVEQLTTAEAIGRFSNIAGLPAVKGGKPVSQSKLAQSAFELCSKVSTAIKPLDARMDANTWNSVISNAAAVAKDEQTAEQVFGKAFDNTAN